MLRAASSKGQEHSWTEELFHSPFEAETQASSRQERLERVFCEGAGCLSEETGIDPVGIENP